LSSGLLNPRVYSEIGIQKQGGGRHRKGQLLGSSVGDEHKNVRRPKGAKLILVCVRRMGAEGEGETPCPGEVRGRGEVDVLDGLGRNAGAKARSGSTA